MKRIWVEIIRGRRKGARGWHDGKPYGLAPRRTILFLPGLEYPRNSIMKYPADLRLLSEVEVMAEQIKGAA